MPNYHEKEVLVQVAGNKMVPSSSDKFFPVGSQPMDFLELSQFYATKDWIEKGTDVVLNTSLKPINNGTIMGTNLQMQTPYYESEKNKIDINSTQNESSNIDINSAQYQSSLFSSSFSEIFTRKLRLPTNDSVFCKPVDTVASCLNDKQFQPVKENETQSIGNLPDEDDLLSGMIDEFGYMANTNSVDEFEDFDLFTCGGGFELEGKEIPHSTWGTSNSQAGSKFIASSSPGVIISRCMGNQPIDSFPENVFSNGSSSVPNTSHFPMTGVSVGNQYGLADPRNRLDLLNFSKYFPSSHPHSLPEHHNNFPCNSLRTNGDVTGNVSSNKTRVSKHFDGTASNWQLGKPNGGVMSFVNLSGSASGHHSNLRNVNLYQHPSPSSIIWPNSPTFVNGIRTCRTQQLIGFHATPPHMISMVSPVHQQHIGSTPSFNPSIWDRRHANNIPHDRVNRMDISANSGLQSQMCNNLPGMGPIMSVLSSYDSSSEHTNGFSHRRNEVNSSCTTDRKQYELDIGRILRGEDKRTTLMLKNIPNKYTSKMLLATIDEHHRGSYDFIYLPIDFKNKCNVGYAFINMIDPRQIVPFHQTFNDKKWEKFNSEKVATLAYARIQGKAALIAHFQNSSLMNEDKLCRPILFHTDGPNAGYQEPFPISSSNRSRLGKPQNVIHANMDEGLASGSDPTKELDSSS